MYTEAIYVYIYCMLIPLRPVMHTDAWQGFQSLLITVTVTLASPSPTLLLTWQVYTPESSTSTALHTRRADASSARS